MGKFEGKIILVTGASRGIGRGIALKFAEQRAHVLINYAKNEKEAHEVARAIESSGGKASCIQADMGDLESQTKLFQRIGSDFQKLDVLVNNAGAVIYKSLASTSFEEFEKIFSLNVRGVFFACQNALKLLPDGGRIINLSSSVTRLMLPTYSAYSASKAAVEQLTRVLAKEVGLRQITVNAVAPGPTDTELFREGKSENQIQQLSQMAALGRLGQPTDIGDAVVFLASEEAKWITGQTIFANGGFA
jgi:3-oxoacyl-[acyl-carrier protein] reductase